LETTEAMKLSIYVGDAARHGGKPLYRSIVKLLHEEDIAGVTVLRGIEGYGSAKRIHTARIELLSLDLPVVIVAIDRKEKIEAIITRVKELSGTEGLMTVERVEVVSPVSAVAGVR
jgi:PII-like signaling protein